ncbi:MAG: AMP-binding protein, partial [Burkholderia sp.]|nr:AMP-binding protein [Burkholderia sp.]
DSSVDALFDSLIVFENYPLDDALDAIGGVPRVRAVDAHNRSHFPLMLVVAPRHVGGGDALRLEWHRHAARVRAEDVARVAGYFEQMLDGLAKALVDSNRTDVRLRDLTSDLAADSVAVAKTAFAYEPVTARIAAQAHARPDAVALVDGDEEVTYAQLDAWSGAIAQELIRLGAGAEVRVGVAMQRSAALVASLLGVLRAGAAYVPLDPSYPAERLAHIVDDSQLRLIVTDAPSLAQHAALFGTRPTLDAVALRDALKNDEPLDVAMYPHSQQLAYVIYTSGSTGTPKGVGITHENIARLFDATQSSFAFDSSDVWTLFHSYAFDFSVWEIFGALVHGARLVIVPHWSAR